MKISIKQIKKRYSLTLILFILCMIGVMGVRRAISVYNDRAKVIAENNRVKEFNAMIRSAKYMAEYGLDRSIDQINSDVKNYVDLTRLKVALTVNTKYELFDTILRNNLQQNIFTSYGLDVNRNNIFVIVNGYLIASYSKDDTYLKEPVRTGEGVILENIIKNRFYNKELGFTALHRLKTQYKGLILYQPIPPMGGVKEMYPMLSDIDIQTLDTIMLYGAKEELASYEILIPKYITDNGNIFGEYDVAGEPKDVNNKIIIVQKLNMVDWIEKFHPDFFSVDKTDSIEYNYNQLLTFINIFIIICCTAMFAFMVYLLTSYNQIKQNDD